MIPRYRAQRPHGRHQLGIADRPDRAGLRRLDRHRFYSGFGGQLDFMRGAARSKGGKPIIALPSTAKNEPISRIVPHVESGRGRGDVARTVRYVVTEYGIAYLHGKTIRQRAEALIQIAHPKFRNELYDYCERTSGPAPTAGSSEATR